MPDLEKIIERVNELAAKNVTGTYAIGGAFAFIFYAEPLNTRDLEFFAEMPTARDLIRSRSCSKMWRANGFTFERDSVLIEGFPVQFLPAPTPLVSEAIREARTVQVGKQSTRVFSAEHAVAIALQTNRPTDRMKIEHLLETGSESLDEARLRSILQRHGLEERWERFREARR
ncbi:MAG TPA: hypothetical protein VGH20_03150 [Myxococcales bacterium]|jgi:hypothetical protein